MNLVEARLERADGGLVCRGRRAGARRPGRARTTPPRARDAMSARTIGLGIRPEQLEDAALVGDAPAAAPAPRQVVTTELLGSELLAHVEIEGRAGAHAGGARGLRRRRPSRVVRSRSRGARPTDGRHRPLRDRLGGASRRRGRDAVDRRRLHFFDLDSEASEGSPGIPARAGTRVRDWRHDGRRRGDRL